MSATLWCSPNMNMYELILNLSWHVHTVNFGLFQACHQQAAGRTWRITCGRQAMSALPTCSATGRVWWSSYAERTWSMRCVSWTGQSSAHIKWVQPPLSFGTSLPFFFELPFTKMNRVPFCQGETAYIRVFEERGTPNWSRSRSRSRSRGRYSPPYHSRGSPPPRFQSPPRHAMSRHSPPPRRHLPQHSPPPRHYR